jgi:tripartite-type tricarboxylate transporter receptor subunit TctC
MYIKPARLVASALSILALASAQAIAQQSYPNRPIHIIMQYPAGAGADIIVREAAPDLSTKMGQPVIVDNRTGGNFIVAAEACQRAAPDGYTWCTFSVDTLSINPNIYSKLSYDPDRDFKPVSQLYWLLEGLMTKASLPVSSVKELQALAVARSGKLNFGTLGPNSNTDIARQWLCDFWKADMLGVPYKGGPLIITALVAGEIDVARIGAYNAISQIKAGKVKLLGIGGTRRSPLLPQVPTLTEAGLGGIPGRAWVGIVVPTGTPDPIIRRVNNELVSLFRAGKHAEFLDTQFVEPVLSSPEEFGAFLAKDREQAAQMVKKFKIPVQ